MASGSFPLMQLAREYGVDYGDVLLMADWLGDEARCEAISWPRRDAYQLARNRLHMALSWAQSASLEGRLTEHVDWRWRDGLTNPAHGHG